MDLTGEGLVLAVFVLVPGFVHYSVSRSFQPPQARKPGDLELVLYSLALTLLLVGAEALAFLAVVSLAAPVREDVEFLLRNGINDYIDRNALALLYTLSSVGLINILTMAAAGWFEVPERLVRTAQQQRGLSEWSTWYRVLWVGPGNSGERRRTGRLPLGVRVRLKKGGLYHGALAAFSLSGSLGDRDLALWEAHYSATGEPADLTKINSDGKSAVIIAASEIESIEVFYPDVPARASEAAGDSPG
jgi:hypothetical protein